MDIGLSRGRGIIASSVAAVLLLSAPARASDDIPGLASSVAATCKPKPVSIHRITSWLRTCGTVIIDSQDRKVRPLSIAVNTMLVGSGDQAAPECGHWALPPTDLYDKIAGWGFNSVQLMVSWANLEPLRPITLPDGTVQHRWDQEYLKAIDQAIAAFAERDVAVILSMVQSRWSPAFRDLVLPNGKVQACGIGMPTWLYPAGGGIRKMVTAELNFFRNVNGVQGKFLAAWRKLAARYALNRSVVGGLLLFEAYDLLAQPYPGTVWIRPFHLKLASFYEKVGRAIARVNPRMLLIYMDHLEWGTGRSALTRKPLLPRDVYSFEFYAGNWFPKGLARVNAYRTRGHGWGLPAWIAEFTAWNYTRKQHGVPYPPRWKFYTQRLMEYAKSHRMGWSLAGMPDWKLMAVLRAGF